MQQTMYMQRLAVKEKLLTVRVKPAVLQDFKIAAEAQGATMSALVHMFVVRTVREAKNANPEAFRPRESERERPVIRAKIKRPRNKERRAK